MLEVQPYISKHWLEPHWIQLGRTQRIRVWEKKSLTSKMSRYVTERSGKALQSILTTQGHPGGFPVMFPCLRVGWTHSLLTLWLEWNTDDMWLLRSFGPHESENVLRTAPKWLENDRNVVQSRRQYSGTIGVSQYNESMILGESDFFSKRVFV